MYKQLLQILLRHFLLVFINNLRGTVHLFDVHVKSDISLLNQQWISLVTVFNER